MRVLYYTVVPLGGAANGGSICCRNHVARLSQDPGIELFGMVAGPLTWKEGTDAFFAQHGVQYHFQPLRENLFQPEGKTIRDVASFAAKAVFQFPWELQALNQPHVEEGIAWAVKAYSIDVLVIDYHPSTLFLRLPRDDVRTVLIGLNREGDFYNDQIQLGQTHHGPLTAPISLWRARRFERRVNAAVDKVVTIGPPDLPRYRLRTPPRCITPYLDPQPLSWSYSASRTAFFVGDVRHYPNRLAIEWLCRDLAPALLQRGSESRITIIGAEAVDIAEPYRYPNIEFLGRSDLETVQQSFRTADLMICPVANDYGVKFKSLEALAFGTPLLASVETMKGLPHIKDVPDFDLAEPNSAAEILDRLMGKPACLQALARSQQDQQAAFIASQRGVWSELFQELVQKPVRARSS